MKSISIDREAYDFIKNNAEPFVDSPNTVLRRLLPGEAEVGSGSVNPIENPGKKGTDLFFALVPNIKEPLLSVTTHGCPGRECVPGFGASTQPSIAVKSG